MKNKSFINTSSRLLVATLMASAFLFINPTKAFALNPTSDASVVSVGGTQVQMTVTQQWNGDQIYTAVYSFKKVSGDTPSNINLYVDVIKNGCMSASGNPAGMPQGCNHLPLTGQDAANNFARVDLNPGNNYYNTVVVTMVQPNKIQCGSVQTDAFVLSMNGSTTFSVNGVQNDAAQGLNINDGSTTYTHQVLGAWTFGQTGMDCPTPTTAPTAAPTSVPTAVPTAAPTVAPSSVPTAVPTSVPTTAPTQTQTQSQSQSQQVIVNGTTPAVVSTVSTPVTELPKTGLPLAGVALTGLVPLGAKLRKFGSKTAQETAASLWTNRELKK